MLQRRLYVSAYLEKEVINFYISPTRSVERKVLSDTLKEYVAYTIDIICNVLPLLKCVSALFGAVGRST